MKKKRIKDIAKVSPRKDTKGLKGQDKVSFAPMEDIGFSKNILLSKEANLEHVENGYTYFSENDILLPKVTPTFENGKGGIATNLKNGIGFGTSEIYAIRISEDADLLFFYYYTLAESFRNKMASTMYGVGGLKRIPEKEIKNYEFVDFSKNKQNQLGMFLEKKTSLIDKKISLLEKKIELYEEYKKSIIKKTIENVKGDVFRLKQRATISTGSQNTEDRDDNGQYPFYVRSQTVEKSHKYDFDELCILTPGDGDVGRIFHIFDGKCGVHQRVYCIRKFKQLDSEYLVLYLKNYFFNHVMKLNQSTTVNSLRLPMFLNFVVKAPKIEEQKEISKKLSLNISKIDKLIELTKKEIELQKEYKKTLINDVVTGKIEV